MNNEKVISIFRNGIRVEFDKKSHELSIEVKDGFIRMDEGVFGIGKNSPRRSVKDLSGSVVLTPTPWGEHPALSLRGTDDSGIWQIVLEICILNRNGCLALRLSACNLGKKVESLKAFTVLEGKITLTKGGSDFVQPRTLDGSAGAGETEVKEGLNRESPNNLLVTWKSTDDAPWNRSIVTGGLTYTDFAKYMRSEKVEGGFKIRLFAEDPIGKRVDPGTTWSTNDWFYIDLGTENPFEALEQFAWKVRCVNAADPNPYTFPTVCGWYASMPSYGGSEFMNDTPGTVREIEAADEKGFLVYSPVAVRLVPDIYDPTTHRGDDPVEIEYWKVRMLRYSKDRSTEQGWWDDEHWHQYGHYVEPYETSEKWAQAMLERGGIPLTYFQTGHVSYDYAKLFPGHMIGNDISELDQIFKGHNPYVTFDYTDPDFRLHLFEVWRNLGDSGVKGLMFDYPNQAWIENGGFEDPYATTTSAYRSVFTIAKEGLGPDSWVQERNVSRQVPYLDVTVGSVDSQRVWGDTDGASIEMYRICGLRWYKTRVLFSYDTDAKNLIKIAKVSRDLLRQVLTMLTLATGRLLLANSFRDLPPEIVKDLSRVYPGHSDSISPCPVDCFLRLDFPQVYRISLCPDVTHLILCNPDQKKETEIEVPLGEDITLGGLGLASDSQFHACDFWNNNYLGVFSGCSKISQTLRPGEARVIRLQRSESHPQIIATDRHLLQGDIELSDVRWNTEDHLLKGFVDLVPGESMALTVAHNNFGKMLASSDPDVEVSLENSDHSDLSRLLLKNKTGGRTAFCLKFSFS